MNEAFDLLPCEFWAGWENVPSGIDGAVVVIHGGNQQLNGAGPATAALISEQVSKLKWALFVIIGDEASEFPSQELHHPNSLLWIQTPKPGVSVADRYLICGYPNDCHDMLAWVGKIEKDLDWSFAGQMTHARRHAMGAAVSGLLRGVLVPTAGFGQGLDHPAYYRLLARSKIVLCPSGPATPDSYRMAEGLEAGCVPLIDGCSLNGIHGYWEMVFGNHPLPVIDDWDDAPRMINEILSDWERISRLTNYWWLEYKLSFRSWLEKDLRKLEAI